MAAPGASTGLHIHQQQHCMEAPPSPLSSRAYQDSYLATPDAAMFAAFVKESRMEFASATHTNRKSRAAESLP